MRRSHTSSVLIAIMLLGSLLPALAVTEEPAKLACKMGPIEKEFGGSIWLVYSCDDGDSLVVVSATGNPAMPFVFFIGRKDGARSLRGEGSGSKEASSAAFDELSTVVESETQVQELLQATRDVGAS